MSHRRVLRAAVCRGITSSPTATSHGSADDEIMIHGDLVDYVVTVWLFEAGDAARLHDRCQSTRRRKPTT